jgi:tetratricopeptide (TPR) repeat protein
MIIGVYLCASAVFKVIHLMEAWTGPSATLRACPELVEGTPARTGPNGADRVLGGFISLTFSIRAFAPGTSISYILTGHLSKNGFSILDSRRVSSIWYQVSSIEEDSMMAGALEIADCRLPIADLKPVCRQARSKIESRKLRITLLVLLCTCLVFCNSALGAQARPALQNAQSSASLRAMARVYMACGGYKKAQPLLERAMNLAQATNAPDDEMCACLIDSAYLYKEQGNLGRAETMCRLGLQLQEKVYRPNHPYVAYTLRILSEIYREQGRYEEAKSALERAMTIMRAVRPDDDQEIAPFKVDKARLLQAAGDLQNAESYYREALEVILRSFGREHLYTAKVQSSLAALYVSQGRYAEAKTLISRALAIHEKVHGPDHPFLVPLWLVTADIDQSQGKTADARTLLEKSLRVVRSQDDSSGLIEAEVLSRLAQLHRKTGNTAEIAKLERRVEEIRVRKQVAYVPLAAAIQ